MLYEQARDLFGLQAPFTSADVEERQKILELAAETADARARITEAGRALLYAIGGQPAQEEDSDLAAAMQLLRLTAPYTVRDVFEHFDHVAGESEEDRRPELEAARSILLRRAIATTLPDAAPQETPVRDEVEPWQGGQADGPRPSWAGRLAATLIPLLILGGITAAWRAAIRREIHQSVINSLEKTTTSEPAAADTSATDTQPLPVTESTSTTPPWTPSPRPKWMQTGTFAPGGWTESFMRRQRESRALGLLTSDPARYRFGTPREGFQVAWGMDAEVRRAIDRAGGPELGAVSVYQKALDFYGPDTRLLYVIDHATEPPSRRLILHYDGQMSEVGWSDGAINALNTARAFAPSSANVIDYVNFCVSVTTSRHGRFLPVESARDIRWRADAGGQVQAAASALRPFEITGTTPAGELLLTGHFLLGDGVIRAQIGVDSSGGLTTTGSQWVLQDLAVVPDIPEAGGERRE